MLIEGTLKIYRMSKEETRPVDGRGAGVNHLATLQLDNPTVRNLGYSNMVLPLTAAQYAELNVGDEVELSITKKEG